MPPMFFAISTANFCSPAKSLFCRTFGPHGATQSSSRGLPSSSTRYISQAKPLTDFFAPIFSNVSSCSLGFVISSKRLRCSGGSDFMCSSICALRAASCSLKRRMSSSVISLHDFSASLTMTMRLPAASMMTVERSFPGFSTRTRSFSM